MREEEDAGPGEAEESRANGGKGAAPSGGRENASQEPDREERRGPLSFEEVHQKRWEALAKKVLDFSAGTLWWVRESLWKEVLARCYDMRSTRNQHPGLSTRMTPIEDLYSEVLMLHGRSRGGGFMVRGLNAGSPGRKTFFFLLGPTAVCDAIPFCGEQRVFMNSDKPRLSEREMEDFKMYMRRRGLIE